jgi:all-trans-retinol 13,14-reductase
MPLAEVFKEVFLSTGAQIRCNSLVTEILSADRNVKGVRLADGEILETKCVVFTGHPRQLVTLSRDSALRPAFRQRLKDSPDTRGAFGAAILWKDAECPVATCDAFIYNTYDMNGGYEQKVLGSNGEPNLVYCAASPRAHDGAFSAVALCGLRCSEMSPWQASRRGDRPETYNRMKHEIAGRMVSVLERKLPGAAGKMEIVDMFTPLTFRDYTRTPGGTAYGLKKSVGAFRTARVTAMTRIRGLVLAGQSVILPGVLGTVISSIDACGVILGYQHLLDRVLRETE